MDPPAKFMRDSERHSQEAITARAIGALLPRTRLLTHDFLSLILFVGPVAEGPPARAHTRKHTCAPPPPSSMELLARLRRTPMIGGHHQHASQAGTCWRVGVQCLVHAHRDVCAINSTSHKAAAHCLAIGSALRPRRDWQQWRPGGRMVLCQTSGGGHTGSTAVPLFGVPTTSRQPSAPADVTAP